MISSKIQNFQSLRHAELVFAPGITVITGSSNSGKTAILRAVRCLVENPSNSRHYVTRGEDCARVWLSTGEYNDVERVRDKTVTYNIGSESFRKSGRVRLEELYPEFPIKRDPDGHLVNFCGEFDLLFPFGRSAPALFKVFEQMASIDDSATVLDTMRPDERGAINATQLLHLHLKEQETKKEAAEGTVEQLKQATDTLQQKLASTKTISTKTTSTNNKSINNKSTFNANNCTFSTDSSDFAHTATINTLSMASSTASSTTPNTASSITPIVLTIDLDQCIYSIKEYIKDLSSKIRSIVHLSNTIDVDQDRTEKIQREINNYRKCIEEVEEIEDPLKRGNKEDLVPPEGNLDAPKTQANPPCSPEDNLVALEKGVERSKNAYSALRAIKTLPEPLGAGWSVINDSEVTSGARKAVATCSVISRRCPRASGGIGSVKSVLNRGGGGGIAQKSEKCMYMPYDLRPSDVSGLGKNGNCRCSLAILAALKVLCCSGCAAGA